jgi:hypothetical protein
MIKKGWMLFLILLTAVGFSGIANAGLTVIGSATYESKDYNLIYEDNQSLIWLDYSNAGSPWPQQMSWASGLNASGVLTYRLKPGVSVSWEGDWRLPKTVDGAHRNGYDGKTTAGFNITTSEIGYLFYTSLGNLGYYDTNGKPRPGWGKPDSQHGWGLKNKGPFANLQNGQYWSSSEYAVYSEHAWDFNMYYGSQGDTAFKSSYNYYGLAVRPGKVVSAPAP